MKIEYNNLYTHFIFTTLHRLPVIAEKNRERIEKYITGIVNNTIMIRSYMRYMLILNIFISWFPVLQNYQRKHLPILLRKALKNSSTKINCVTAILPGSSLHLPFLYLNQMLTEFVNT